MLKQKIADVPRPAKHLKTLVTPTTAAGATTHASASAITSVRAAALPSVGVFRAARHGRQCQQPQQQRTDFHNRPTLAYMNVSLHSVIQ